jgi:hypothetical protein
MQALAGIAFIMQETRVTAPCDTMKLVDCLIDFCLVVTPLPLPYLPAKARAAAVILPARRITSISCSFLTRYHA